ncbi:MAG: chemotaxis response regulator protein-glutamate methylesterase [Prolixibacteraceae bacterium]
MRRKIKVLVVDDSVSVQKSLTQILGHDPDIEVIGCAANPYEAVSKIAENLPDVITLDIEMPRMDGLTFLRKLMNQHPISVVVISSMAGEASDLGIKALRLGALEIITKPKMSDMGHFEEYRIRITDAVKAAAMTGPVRRRTIRENETKPDAILKSEKITKTSGTASENVILIGASTGGTEVISYLLKNLKPDLPGILIVQHMPGEFTGAFARRLNLESKLEVKEAENGDLVETGKVYIANGYQHLKLVKEDMQFKCKLEMDAMVNRHRPSVDVLFHSASHFPGKNITAVLLTGMGSDGAKGMLELYDAGAMTFAQDEESSVIFGMPKAAIKINAARKICNPAEIIHWLNNTYR